MFKPGKYRQLPLLLALLLAGGAHGATQDDELLVDPTAPLDVQLAGNSSAGDGGFEFVLGANGLLAGFFNSFELSSVLIRGDHRIAVINEQRVHEGDSIGNATVVSIAANSVTLNVDGEIEILELYENSIKTLVKGED